MHVEMRFGERCLTITHDAGKYQALLEHLQALVEALVQ